MGFILINVDILILLYLILYRIQLFPFLYPFLSNTCPKEMSRKIQK